MNTPSATFPILKIKTASAPTGASSLNQILFDRYIKAGQTALKLKNLVEAEQMFNLAKDKVSSLAEHIQATQSLASVQVGRKNYRSAEKWLLELLPVLEANLGTSSPEYVDCVKMLSEALEKQGLLDQATQLLRNVLKNIPVSDATAHYQMRTRYEQLREKVYSTQEIHWRD